MKIKKIRETFLTMSNKERNGTIILLVLIILTLVLRFCIPLLGNDNVEISGEVIEKLELLAKEKEKRGKKGEQARPWKAKEMVIISSENDLFYFDPNKVGFKQMTELGISERVAQNILKYRERGGKFFKKEDLKKIYGIDSIFYKKVESYIVIEKEKQQEKQQEKQKREFEINSADSASWTTLSGIGPYFAGKICKYRNILGGFVSIEQIKEVYNFKEETYERIKGQLKVDVSLVERININFIDISGLKRHPYCRYENARKIIDYRSKYGSFNSVEQLKKDSVLIDSVYNKLSPYLIIE